MSYAMVKAEKYFLLSSKLTHIAPIADPNSSDVC